ncbi:hypothetical protein Bsp3421_001888 [Burkholderia sp. FERM BP-3421]|jgi:hypothetical protein|uniref:hypothetical protein n=1 Tax=Burkholderia sp. FERM BP-3421 TaxID=1494466 RepID=UPI00235F72E4|nr:hypothetical protein [Burkholderia sp. FERM BP-3421]WDD91927.1 hypothetical protein Bsp3421_001888 [Burkholderia sp. FERM BP-3421]
MKAHAAIGERRRFVAYPTIRAEAESLPGRAPRGFGAARGVKLSGGRHESA